MLVAHRDQRPFQQRQGQVIAGLGEPRRDPTFEQPLRGGPVPRAASEREGVDQQGRVVRPLGELVAERYAPGYDADTPLPGWSMTKTMVDALVGIRDLNDETAILISTEGARVRWAEAQR